MNLRPWITELQNTKELVQIKQPMELKHQITTEMLELSDRPALFENIKGCFMPLVTNLLANKALLGKALGISPSDLVHRTAMAIDRPLPPKQVPNGGYLRWDADLTRLPIPTFYPKDGGPYVTAAIFVADDPEYGLNSSFHRMMLIDPTHLAVRILPRHFHRYVQRGNREFAICIGAPAQVQLASAISCEIDKSELAIANAIKATDLIEIENHRVPDAEIILIARLLDRTHAEGPFVDLTGTYDIVRQEPVVEIQSMYIRSDAVFHAILPGGFEHKLLMGFPREPSIWREVNRVTRCLDVTITPGGCSWLHAVVKIDKQNDQDGFRAIQAAFAGHASLKQVIVVDRDIDISDPCAVEWAMATRFQADQDLVVMRDQKGSSLDPSADPNTQKTAKMGVDATIPCSADPEKFRRPEASVP
jgi:UbiD family decarboxylase